MFSVEEQIEYLCSCEFSDYKLLKSQIRLERTVMPDKQPLLRTATMIRAEQDEIARRKKRLQEFDDYKKGLRAKTPEEMQALVEQRMAEAAHREQQELLDRIEAERKKFRPDWTFWLHMPDVELWQACALSLDIDPDKMKHEPNSWMAGPGADRGPFFLLASFPNKATEGDFNKRLRLAKANHGGSGREKISLPDFIAWALSIPLFQSMPAELTDLVKHETAAGPVISLGTQEVQPNISGDLRIPAAPSMELVESGNNKQRGAPNDETWTLNKPQRIRDPLTKMIYDVLKDVHVAGKARPKAREVMELIKEKKSADFLELTGDDIKFVANDGNTGIANIEAVRERINRMTK